MSATGRFITDPKQIVWWAYEDSLGLKEIGTKRVHVLADGTAAQNPLVPGRKLSSLSEALREDIVARLTRDRRASLPVTRWHVTGDLAQVHEADVRAEIKAAAEDAVIVVSEQLLQDYMRRSVGKLASPAIGKGEPGFELHDASAVSSWDFPKMEFLVDQLIPRRGLTWLAGRAKRGKSLLAVYLGLAIACDRDLAAERFEIREHPNVLYICREDPGGRLQARIQDITATWDVAPEPGRFLAVVRPHFDISRHEHLEWLLAVSREREIGLVILDTWTALSPTADPLGAKEQTVLAQSVANFAHAFGEAVVVLDHTRKNKQQEGGPSSLSSADILGPSQKWQAAEHILMLADTSQPGRIEAFMEGKDTATERFFLDVSAEGSGTEKFTFAGTVEEAAEARRQEGAENLEKVFQAIVKQPSTTAQLMAVTGLSRATVKRHLANLREARRVDVDVDVYKAIVEADTPF